MVTMKPSPEHRVFAARLPGHGFQIQVIPKIESPLVVADLVGAMATLGYASQLTAKEQDGKRFFFEPDGDMPGARPSASTAFDEFVREMGAQGLETNWQVACIVRSSLLSGVVVTSHQVLTPQEQFLKLEEAYDNI